MSQDNDTPFFSIGIPVDEVPLDAYVLRFYTVFLDGHDITIGMVLRSSRKNERKNLITIAKQKLVPRNLEDKKILETIIKKEKLARAEEWILSRFIIKHGASLHLKTTNSSRESLNVSITHSSLLIAVVFASLPIGIDHEIVQIRDESWRRKMDPSDNINELLIFFKKWNNISQSVAETILWCMKEATLKAYGKEKKINALSSISIRMNGEKIITVLPDVEFNYENFILLDEKEMMHTVLAIAFQNEN